MKVLHGLVWFMASLIGTGGAPNCTSCVAVNSCAPGCTSDLTVQCPTNEQCATAYRKTSRNGIDTYDIIRTCAPSQMCSKVGSFFYSNIKMTLGIGCCSTNNCTPTLPQLSTESSASNGVQCRSCSSLQSTGCQTAGNITCTGERTKCVAYSQLIAEETSVYEGCGSPSLCDIQQYTAKIMGVTVQHRFKCSTNGVVSSGLAPRLILTAVICVILKNQ